MTALDPIFAAIAADATTGPGPFEGSVPDARRRLTEAITAHTDTGIRELVGSTSPAVAYAGGQQVPVRITAPRDAPAQRVVVFVHPGGYALGSAELADDTCRRLSLQLDAVVIAVDYRLAPEHPFDAILQDVVTALRWTRRHRDELAFPESPIVLVGESSGANLAAAASQIAPEGIAVQVLVVPGPDLEAMAELTDVPGAMLTVADLSRILELTFSCDRATAWQFPASAARGEHLENSPPTVVALAGYDPTVTIGRSYADALSASGTTVTLLEFDAVFHAFLGFAHISPAAADAFSAVSAATLTLLDELEGTSHAH